MQSLYGRIQVVTRNTINGSTISGSKSARAFGLVSSQHNAFSSNKVVDSNLLRNPVAQPTRYLSLLAPKFASGPSLILHENHGAQTGLLTSFNNKGIPPVARFCRDLRSGSFQWVAVVPNFPSRCITTMGYSSEPVSQTTSASVADVAPRVKFKRLDKTAKHIMQILDKEAVEEVRAKREIPDIKPGYIIQLKLEVPENKRRNSVLKGIVIARRNAGLNTTIRLRRLVAGVGVESLLPLYSPNIKEIQILDKKKVRRAKLYYIRDRLNPLKR